MLAFSASSAPHRPQLAVLVLPPTRLAGECGFHSLESLVSIALPTPLLVLDMVLRLPRGSPKGRLLSGSARSSQAGADGRLLDACTAARCQLRRTKGLRRRSERGGGNGLVRKAGVSPATGDDDRWWQHGEPSAGTARVPPDCVSVGPSRQARPSPLRDSPPPTSCSCKSTSIGTCRRSLGSCTVCATMRAYGVSARFGRRVPEGEQRQVKRERTPFVEQGMLASSSVASGRGGATEEGAKRESIINPRAHLPPTFGCKFSSAAVEGSLRRGRCGALARSQ